MNVEFALQMIWSTTTIEFKADETGVFGDIIRRTTANMFPRPNAATGELPPTTFFVLLSCDYSDWINPEYWYGPDLAWFLEDNVDVSKLVLATRSRSSALTIIKLDMRALMHIASSMNPPPEFEVGGRFSFVEDLRLTLRNLDYGLDNPTVTPAVRALFG